MSTISLKEVSVIIDGRAMTDIAPEGVSITFTNDLFSHVSGVNSSTRLRNVDESGTVELNLLPTSVSCGVLDAILDEDILTNNKRFGFTCVDNLNGESYQGINCYFTKRPDATFSNDVNNRVYTFVVPQLIKDGSVSAS